MNVETDGRPDATWSLTVLGTPRLARGAAEVKLPRFTFALLAYLALEGETPKSRFSEWFWPDSGGVAARANLRKTLQRLRDRSGADLVRGEDALSLADDVEVDAVALHRLAFAGEHARVLAWEGTLLDGFAFDDAPDFDEWLFATREGLDALRRDAANAEVARREGLGDAAGALEVARRALDLDPLSEEAHRAVMRLHARLGDRGAALAQFERCRAALREAFGVEPAPETVALARQIERSGSAAPKAAERAVAVPAALLLPPFTGRAREWAALERAREDGVAALLAGEPGAGKSRLAREFAASTGEPVAEVRARPGDTGVPYATLVRFLRDRADLVPTLAPWARAELARLAPDFGPAPEGEASRLRLQQAFEAFARAALPGAGVLLIEDLHAADPSSAEMLLFDATAAAGSGRLTLVTLRDAETTPALREALDRLVESEAARLLPIGPLAPEDVRDLLAALPLPNLADGAIPVTRFTGGNPLFVLETVRHLHENGLLERGWPARLPPPGRVVAVIERRLARLGEDALRAARGASVLDDDFTLARLARFLRADPWRLADAWRELEGAGLVVGERFGHDLVRETLLAGLGSLRAPLHADAARLLGEEGAAPARVAEHWALAGEMRAAVEAWMHARTEYSERGLTHDGVRVLRRALEHDLAPDLRVAVEAPLANLLAEISRFEEARELAERVLASRPTDELRASALVALTIVREAQGDVEGALALVHEGLALPHAGEEQRMPLQLELGKLLNAQGRYEDAAGVLEEMAAKHATDPHRRPRAYRAIQITLASAYQYLGRYERAYALSVDLYRLSREAGDLVCQVASASTLVACDLLAGFPNQEETVPIAREAVQITDVTGIDTLRNNFAVYLLRSGRSEEAVEQLRAVARDARELNLRANAAAIMARPLAEAGRHDEANEALRDAIALFPDVQIEFIRVRVVLNALNHGDAVRRAWAAGHVDLLRAATVPPNMRPEVEAALRLLGAAPDAAPDATEAASA